MNEQHVLEREQSAMNLTIGKRSDFDRVEFKNKAGLKASFFKNGATHQITLGDIMVNQMEGHPLDGAMDRVYLRSHEVDGIDAFPMSGSTVDCAIHKKGMRWLWSNDEFDASVELMLHPTLPILYRVCQVTNNGAATKMIDWMAGQDVGLAVAGALKSNEAYVCQYLDHKIAVHPISGKVVLSRNNLAAPNHPFAANFCLQGARSASTDGYQFFGTASKMNGRPAVLDFQTLEDRVKQYEFAYAALQSRKVELQPCQTCITVFATYVVPEHPEVSSASDLELIDLAMKQDLPKLGDFVEAANASAFFSEAELQPVHALEKEELESLFAGEWRHIEKSDRHELHSFFCGEDTHVVLPAKEAIVERQHGTILKSAHGAGLDEHVLCITCYGFGAFGSQFSVGNTSFGRFTTILRNSLNLDRSSGLRIFAADSEGWKQLGFPSVYAMDRDRSRWIYKTETATFEIQARATAQTIEYTARPILGKIPPLRLTLEVCGDANEFDAAPEVTWDQTEKLLALFPAEGSLLKSEFPASCMLTQIDADTVSVSGADALGGSAEPYVVIDFPDGEFSLAMTGHYDGTEAALKRFDHTENEDWNALMANFGMTAENAGVSTLSDTLKWYAHNAMIHFAAPRGMEQYGGAAWGTRDVCQGPLEFLLSLGHDEVAAEMLLETYSHQFIDTGTWPQWFMFDGFREIQQHESHGDIVYWPIKALCDYIEQTGDFQILEKEARFAESEETVSIYIHVQRAVKHIMDSCVSGTSLPSYGDGDWNDSLQPANQEMKTNMVSGWTVGLAYQSLTALSKVWKKSGRLKEAEELDVFLCKMFKDFQQHIIEDGVAAGFVLFGDEETTHMLHPSDEDGIKCRLLPINRSIISELFTPEEMDSHLDLAARYLKFPDGMRLMDQAPAYTGGKSTRFQRAETASHFGREIGLQYVHAHIRYCEAMAKVGRAEELLDGLLQISPVAIKETVPNARPRQANLYFSSSDAEVYDRYEASASMGELKKGNVGALGGWRLYSSGPGIYIGLVISKMFGLRRSYGSVEIDPVLPKSMNGAVLDLDLFGKRISWVYHVEHATYAPRKIVINGTEMKTFQTLENPYRSGGLRVKADALNALLNREENTVEIYL